MNTTILVVTSGAWAKGKTEAEAVRRLRDHAGASTIKSAGYTVYRAHEKAFINDHGSMVRPAGTPEPELIADKRTNVLRQLPARS